MSAMLWLIRGLPGSGKSTLASLLASAYPAAAWVEADQFFETRGEYCFNPALLQRAHEDCLVRAEFALKDGIPVFVANTFSRKWEAEPYLSMAARLRVPVQIITCGGCWPSSHGVPESVVDRMRARFESAESWLLDRVWEGGR